MNSIERMTVEIKLYEIMCAIEDLKKYVNEMPEEEHIREDLKTIILESCAFALCDEDERHEILKKGGKR